MDNPKKINISEIADYVSQSLKDHVIFHDKSEADALTAWIVLTYFIEQMDIFPFVLITSPEPQCGKSTALRMLSAFVKNPQSASRITPAAIHRVIQRDQPTLLLDEADRFVLNNQELIGILNAGHARFDAHVIINQKQTDGNWEPAEFSVWCAKAIAGIEVKDDTITSRSLVIRLRRKLISEPISRYTYDYPLKQHSVREQIEAWAANIQLSDFKPLELSGTTDRSTDNWIALGQIAQAMGNDWPDRIRHSFKVMEMNSPKTSDDIKVEFLHDIQEVLDDHPHREIQSSALLNLLLNKEDSDWLNQNGGRAITQRWVAKTLSAYGVKPLKRSMHNVYVISELVSVFERYLPPKKS